MGTEAARLALRTVPRDQVDALWFATANPFLAQIANLPK